MVYPALLPLMCTPRLPVVDWTDVPCRFKCTRPFRRRTKSGFRACAVTFKLASTYPDDVCSTQWHTSLKWSSLYTSIYLPKILALVFLHISFLIVWTDVFQNSLPQTSVYSLSPFGLVICSTHYQKLDNAIVTRCSWYKQRRYIWCGPNTK